MHVIHRPLLGAVHRFAIACRMSGDAPITVGMRALERIMQVERGVARIPARGALANQATSAAREGSLVRVFPRVVMAAPLRDDPVSMMRAVLLWRPDAVFLGRAALKVLGREVEVRDVEFAVPVAARAGSHLRPWRWSVPGAIVVGDEVRCTSPAATAVMLAASGDWGPVCDLLREGVIHPGEAKEARRVLGRIIPAATLDRVLLEISGRPWSVAELWLHRALRLAGVTGWDANVEVDCAGRRCVLDLRFVVERVAVEVEGHLYHGSVRQFEDSARRQAALEAGGWHVIRVTATMVRDDPQAVVGLLDRQLQRKHRSTRPVPGWVDI